MEQSLEYVAMPKEYKDKKFQKTAFLPPQQSNQKNHKSFGEQFSTIVKHPVQFAKATLGGEAVGLTGGAIGGVLVAAPLAAYWAIKAKDPTKMLEIANARKGFFKSMNASAPTYGQRLAHHLYELGKGETVGGGVVGLGLGGRKFFQKYNNERQNA